MGCYGISNLTQGQRLVTPVAWCLFILLLTPLASQIIEHGLARPSADNTNWSDANIRAWRQDDPWR